MSTISSAPSTGAPPRSRDTDGTPTLRPGTAPSGYVFPAIWSFPPFFTLQPNPQTFAHQLGLWTQLVLSWAKFHRAFTLNASAVDGGDCREAFHNPAINHRKTATNSYQTDRHTSSEGRYGIPPVDNIAFWRLRSPPHTSGLVSPDPPQQNSTYLIYWKKPEEWASIIYSWISDNGLTGSIMTFYELTEGDMAHTTEFYQLPPSLLRRALDVLVKQGKAQVFKGEDVAEGVKFF
ncbi:hypothetical protein QFC21_005840 [Naganishia friedmannii]|uniref:Uncharacterized protein n=1 Tax=Naganishia friedmannii TaxID=89922 RepID=A0ACC2V6H0_9TREE|nr:hypothetical protein QFC21_005840 [Naganishia friedmannii]